MAGRRDKPEGIVLKLRQVAVLQGQGSSVAEAVRQIGVTQQTYCRWRKEYGGMSRDQLKRLKHLETENQRLMGAVPDLTLDKMVLAEAARRVKAAQETVQWTVSGLNGRSPGALPVAVGVLIACGRPLAYLSVPLPGRRLLAIAERGYRMITGMLNDSGWHVNHKRLSRA